MTVHLCVARLVKTTDLPPGKNYIICSHPHGVLCLGAFCCYATEGAGFGRLFPSLTPHLLTLEGQFWMPGFRLGRGAL